MWEMKLPLLPHNSEIIIEYAHFTYKSKDIFTWKCEHYHHNKLYNLLQNIENELNTNGNAQMKSQFHKKPIQVCTREIIGGV
jgi:hypothetical protein